MNEPVNARLDEDQNSYITETAGFIPLEVKFKRFEQAGQIMQFSASEFTSSDMRSIYLNPDFEITPEDDLEDINDKLIARNQYIRELKKEKSKVGSSERTADSPSESAAAQKEEKIEEKE